MIKKDSRALGVTPIIWNYAAMSLTRKELVKRRNIAKHCMVWPKFDNIPIDSNINWPTIDQKLNWLGCECEFILGFKLQSVQPFLSKLWLIYFYMYWIHYGMVSWKLILHSASSSSWECCGMLIITFVWCSELAL